MTENLNTIKKKLQKLNKQFRNKNFTYFVPKDWVIWTVLQETEDERVRVNPFKYFLNSIDKIENISSNLSNEISPSLRSNHLKLSIISDLSYNHNTIDEQISKDEYPFNLSGSFLKAISILPYLHSIGINSIILEPINLTSLVNNENGGINKKSSYSVRNPYKLDENLDEDFLELDLETQYKAFVEAAHSLRINIIQEFVFRSASIDSEIALDHPEWFYWIKSTTRMRPIDSDSNSKYGSPIFKKREINEIEENIALGRFDNLPQPDDKYQSMFTTTPVKTARVENKIYGMLNVDKANNKKTNECTLPLAFEIQNIGTSELLKEDKTYYKLYDNPDYNYLSFDTIRYYNTELKKIENIQTDLWEFLTTIPTYHINKFGIDGMVFTDGNLLPLELFNQIINGSKSIKSDFIILANSEENINENQFEKYDGYYKEIVDNQENCNIVSNEKTSKFGKIIGIHKII